MNFTSTLKSEGFVNGSHVGVQDGSQREKGVQDGSQEDGNDCGWDGFGEEDQELSFGCKLKM